MKFTFKNEQPATGLASVGDRPGTDIKLDGKKVGFIACVRFGPNTGQWEVRLAVKKEVTKDNPAPFKWMTFARKHPSRQEAREWVAEKGENIIATYPTLHQFDN